MIEVEFPGIWGSEKDTATFDISHPVNYKFFAELQYVSNLPGVLKNEEIKPYLSDHAPDLLGITISSTTSLVDTYGRDSLQLRAALHLLDTLLPFVWTRTNKLWDGMIGEIVLLGSHQSSVQTADKRDVIERISHLMPKLEGVSNYFPSLYLSSEEASRICLSEPNLFPNALQPFGFHVYCPSLLHSQSLYRYSPYVLMSVGSTSSNSTTPTSNDVQRFQIILWMSIIMAFAVYWAVYTIGFMKFKKDSLLYSTFNPGWEDRKRH